jgi:hypothetical protein
MELIAMKLCKLKMEADKTSIEEHARKMEQTLAALHGTPADAAAVRASFSSTLGSLAGSRAEDCKAMQWTPSPVDTVAHAWAAVSCFECWRMRGLQGPLPGLSCRRRMRRLRSWVRRQ